MIFWHSPRYAGAVLLVVLQLVLGGERVMAAGSPACIPIIAQYGCLAVYFGCPQPPVPCPISDMGSLANKIQQHGLETALQVALQLFSDTKNETNKAIVKTPISPNYTKYAEVLPPPVDLSRPCYKNTSTATDIITQNAENLNRSYMRPESYHGTTAELQQLYVCRQVAATQMVVESLAYAQYVQAYLKDFAEKQKDSMDCTKLVGEANRDTLFCLEAQENQLRLDQKKLVEIQQNLKIAAAQAASAAVFLQTTNRNLQ